MNFHIPCNRSESLRAASSRTRDRSSVASTSNLLIRNRGKVIGVARFRECEQPIQRTILQGGRERSERKTSDRRAIGIHFELYNTSPSAKLQESTCTAELQVRRSL